MQGANVGFYSVFLAKLLKAGRVLAVEPAPASVKRLKANLMRNCVSDRVLVFEGAAGSISGKAVLNVVPGMEEYSFLGENPHEAVADAEVMQIAVAEVTLDSLTDSYKLNPGFIKVDVEGYELDVLLGAQATLQTARPVILVESAIASSTSPKDQRLRLFEYLASIRYFPLDPISGKTMRARDLLEEVLFVPLERTNGRRQST
jgi:FkbM family methyltransferase